MAFGEEIAKILPEWDDSERARVAFEKIWDDLAELPLLREEEIDRVVDRGHFTFGTISKPWRLSKTQEEVLRSLANGESAEQIATRRGIKLKTVHTHLQRARVRLRVHSNAEAVSVAIGSGIFPAINRDPELGDRMNVKGLAERHKTVLKLLAQGDTNEEIGEVLGLATESVKDRVTELCQLMGARNRTHAVALGFTTGRLEVSSSQHHADREAA